MDKSVPLSKWFSIYSVLFRLEFKLADFWVGAYYCSCDDHVDVWICLVPCFPVHLRRGGNNGE